MPVTGVRPPSPPDEAPPGSTLMARSVSDLRYGPLSRVRCTQRQQATRNRALLAASPPAMKSRELPADGPRLLAGLRPRLVARTHAQAQKICRPNRFATDIRAGMSGVIGTVSMTSILRSSSSKSAQHSHPVRIRDS